MTDDTKACPACCETIKAVAIKCRFCNTDLAGHASTQQAEAETVLFSGHPQVIHTAWQWLAVVLTLGIAWLVYHRGDFWHPRFGASGRHPARMLAEGARAEGDDVCAGVRRCAPHCRHNAFCKHVVLSHFSDKNAPQGANYL